MAFYRQAAEEMHPLIDQALSEQKDLARRIRAVLDVKFRYFEPNRKFLGALCRHAADPEHPLSPFSEETRDTREADIQRFEDALSESGAKVPKDLRAYLPRLLWLYQMGLILFWIYDRSPGQNRTGQLIDKSLPLVVNLIRITRFPLLRPIRKMIVDLLDAVYGSSI
jgi:AcrR family transcriptional regulator